MTMVNTIVIRWRFVAKLACAAVLILLIFYWWYPKGYVTKVTHTQGIHLPRTEDSKPVLKPPNQVVRQGLSERDGKFYLEDKPLTILSGAMHYFRIVPQYWEDRLMKLKAAGLNTVETYMPWNLHEEIKGEWNFKDMLDIRRYLQLANKLGLHVILRPGPYICSEWELGGLPSWLLRDPIMKLRTTYEPFITAANRYMSRVMQEVHDLQYQRGGPIIAFQVENEYGSYGSDTSYMQAIKKMFTDHGAIELLFTSDNKEGLSKGMVPGAVLSINFKQQDRGKEMMEQVKRMRPGNPCMVMEFWTGWFDHWTGEHNTWGTADFEAVLQFILQSGCSVNLYMFHGGTNFGFMNGANQWETLDYKATITSYDYDAPLSEAGQLHHKYDSIKSAVQKYAKDSVPDPWPAEPASVEKYKYGIVTSKELLPWETLLEMVEPIKKKNVVPMEMLDINNGGGQGYGYIVYRKTLTKGGVLKLHAPVRDRAIVLLDGAEHQVFMYNQNQAKLEISFSKESAVLDIVVENMGRVNYGPGMDTQKKGLQKDPTLDGISLEDWEIFPLEMNSKFIKRLSQSNKWVKYSQPSQKSPSVTRGVLPITGSPRDTFIYMKGWEKGVVYINDFNLGRYWNLGPQETLYVPAPLLHPGDNQVVIFELHKPDSEVSFIDEHHIGSSKPV